MSRSIKNSSRTIKNSGAPVGSANIHAKPPLLAKLPLGLAKPPLGLVKPPVAPAMRRFSNAKTAGDPPIRTQTMYYHPHIHHHQHPTGLLHHRVIVPPLTYDLGHHHVIQRYHLHHRHPHAYNPFTVRFHHNWVVPKMYKHSLKSKIFPSSFPSKRSSLKSKYGIIK